MHRELQTTINEEVLKSIGGLELTYDGFRLGEEDLEKLGENNPLAIPSDALIRVVVRTYINPTVKIDRNYYHTYMTLKEIELFRKAGVKIL